MNCARSSITIRLLRGKSEAVACARIAAASDPWLRLRRNLAYVLKQLGDPRKEAHVALLSSEDVGSRPLKAKRKKKLAAERQALPGRGILGFIILDQNGPLGGYIQAIAVHPDWRGRGIGRELIAFAEKRIFRKSSNVFLCVSSFNSAAQKFYRRLAYERVGELKDYVVKGYSEILMRKSIGPTGRIHRH
ncbi:MAG: N-acetyltransferase [Verrucomicrobia bacterium]|nr:MAG: N-acetyltransferase [Verrucomicrobiota bacterium]